MVSSVSIDCLSILSSAMSNRMVTPLPDKSTTHFIVILNHLEIIFKISRSVSHAVTVLYQKERFASIFIQIFLNFGKRWVHPAVHIQIAVIICFIIITVSCTLILCDAVWIKFLCPSKCFFKVAAISTFISHRPHDDTKTVFVTFHHEFYTINDCLFPYRIICNLLIPSFEPIVIGVFFSVDHKWTMSFNICFIYYHESILVTHFIEKWCVRIVAGTDRIKIMLLH